MFKWLGVFLFIFSLGFDSYAQENKIIISNGFKGEELICMAVHPHDSNIVFVGTNRGLYEKDVKEGQWKPLAGIFEEGYRVNQILFNYSGTVAYIATDKGLWLLESNTKKCKNIFNKSDELERSCLSVCILDDNSIFLGTQGGLFLRKKEQGEWIKINSSFDTEGIVYLYGVDKTVYLSVESGIFKSEDFGKKWEKIFNVYSYNEVNEEGIANNDSDLSDEESSSIKHITGSSKSPSILYIATTLGAFFTEDGGKKWERLPLAGLDAGNLRFLLLNSGANHLYTVVKMGVYEFSNEKWKLLFMANDCRQIAQKGPNLMLLTSRDFIEYPISNEKADIESGAMSPEKLLKSFNNEPSIQEVQQMAIQYCEVSDQKIKDWRRRANVKAFMPEVSLGYDTNIWGSSSGACFVGPKTWDVNLSWDLSELVYSSDQTSIDTRSKLMVQLRNDILSEVTRIYFERRKLQMELNTKKDINSQEELDKKLRLEELTALLDRLTGGQFSRLIQNNKMIP